MTEIYLGSPEENTVSWIKKYATPFYVEVLEDGHIQINKSKTDLTHTVSLIYSFDNKNWNDWDYLTGIDVIAGQKFYLKAKTENETFCNYTRAGWLYFSITGKVNVAGNIMSLLSNSNFASIREIQHSYCFECLFKDCINLIDASNLILPATNIDNATMCYSFMFYNCTSLVKAPELPATIVDPNNQYISMFYNCSSLEQAFYLPAVLPATKTLKSFSFLYRDIFYNCLKITEIHYPVEVQNYVGYRSGTVSIIGEPWLGAKNATIYYDL